MPSAHDDAVSRRRLDAVLTSGLTPGWVPEQRPDVVAPGVAALGWRERLRVAPRGLALGWLFVAGLLVLLVSAYFASRHPGAAAAPPAAPAPAAAPLPTPSVPSIVVDVGGRVRHPGLVTLPQGARVADAIAAAGGALRPDDIATVDLAARVSDGQLLLIGVPGGVAGLTGSGGGAPIDLNGATVDQLDALPGVGPVLAQRIVDWRQAHGGFRSVDDLQQVPGIGARKFADLKARVTV